MTRTRLPRPFILGVLPLLSSCAWLGAGVPEGVDGAATEWEPLRTAWGDPNIQGNWSNATLTSLERREGVEGPTFTPAQVDSIEGGEQARFEAGLRAEDPNRPVLEPGNVGGYNQIYFDRGDRVAVIDGVARTSLITHPPDGRIPELTSEGRARMREHEAFRDRFGEYDHPELRPLGERCIVSFGSSMGPPMLPNYFYNNNYTIVQNRDHVLILAEMVHDTRIIRLNEPEPLPPNVRPWFGDSRGYWEGDTLVIETTNVPTHQIFNEEFTGILHSEDLKVIERLTPVAVDEILYEFEVHDPGTYVEPWGGQIPFHRFNEALYEYACHEGNYALENILRGARFQEEQGR